jgi:RNA polymerase sigma factor (sigma-70 family)
VPDSPLSVVSDYLRAASARADRLSDAELLAEFVAGSSEAFAVLVRRHGPMVLGVCRRTLGPTPDADDAFQATFLSLACGARRVTDTVPGWLFRVASRTARKALRRSTATPVETPAPPTPDAMEWGEVRRLLDEELGQLPDRWRAPLVLCYLDGLTRGAAAKRLGWSLRTLHRRLDEGRERLRARLVRRGLAPALLATAVLGEAEVRATVPPLLARETLARGLGESTVPPAVQALIFRPVAKGGLAMSLALTLAVVVGGLGLAVGGQPRPAIDRPPIDVAPPALVFAPVPKPRAPADPLEDEIKAVRKKAIAYLLKEQKAGEAGTGHWDPDSVQEMIRGGPTALAVLALLENGLSPKEEAVSRSLAYLRTVTPVNTYVVSLQTQAFCRANQKKDADRIKKNVQWLEKAAARGNTGELLGWSYTANPVGRADNSNTRYAVAGLYAAHDAGFKVEGKTFWSDVRELFVRTQRKTGGWGYVELGAKETHTMTMSGLVCLEAAARVLDKPDEAGSAARKAGESWVADNFQLMQTHGYYNLDVIGAYGRLAEVRHFGTGDKKRDWFREGLDLVKAKQEEDGHFKHDAGDMSPIVSTSFVLRFLASRVP